MKNLALLLIIACSITNSNAQSKSDISGKAPITWLGLDFTHLRFIGDANQYKDLGTITSRDMRSKYFPAWNDLFVKEKDKYNVADAVNRSSVTYAISVTDNANSNSDGDYFTNNAGDYQLLTAGKIADLVSRYDFKGNTGIGMLFFVEGLSKDQEEGSMWVTFVNMGSKTVLATQRETGRAGGFGFRNYYAKAFLNVLKDFDLKRYR